jgi:soluble lytic murein transglycosylase
MEQNLGQNPPAFSRFSRALGVLAAVLCLFLLAVPLYYPRRYGGMIAKAATEYGVSPALISAVIFAESGFHPNAESAAGAKGLMQLVEPTAYFCAKKIGLSYSPQKLVDPAYNIALGTFYLSYLLKKFGSEPLALAAYNAGEGNVRQWLADGLTEPPFPETKRYVDRVLRAKHFYRILGVKG